MKILKSMLVNLFGILLLVTTVSMMTPNASFLQSYLEAAWPKDIQLPAAAPSAVESISSAFHFLEPIAPATGDPSKFDSSLLKYLKVEVCEVGSNGCTLIKTFTSQGSDAIRITFTGGYGNFYIVNWDTKKSNLSNRNTYRVSVSAADILLGSVDLTPAMYSSFGRTWPIKFMIEKDAELRIRVLAAAGKNLWQIADDLRTDFGLCDDELQQLLLDIFPNADPELVAEVVNGICQDIELFPTTKIADQATRDALAFYDPSTGRMDFVGDTSLLKNLKVNDVLVSRESSAALYGYLRKVTSIRKVRGMYTLETVQAKFTEAIKRGTLQVSGPLEPADDANNADQSQMVASNPRSAEFDIGRSIPFTRHIDETIDLETGDDEIGGSGTIRVVGDIEIQAGYNIGAGIELCATPPFACADRVEAWMGYVHKSKLRVIGNFEGHLRKEIAHPIRMSPIFFMIGPIPVWLVPEIKVIIGFDGTAHVNFEFAAAADSTVKPYIKWTEDEGWKDLTAFAPLSNSFFDAKFDGNVRLEGYAKLDAALLLYGVIGPAMDGSLGIVGTAQTGQSPFWKIEGHVKAGIGLRSVFMDLFDVDAHEDFLDETFLIEEADKLPPQFSEVRAGPIPARINQTVEVGPGGVLGIPKNYVVTDPEGGAVALSVSAPGGLVISQSPLRVRYDTPGLKTVTITARDPDNLTNTLSLGVDVRNSPPVVSVNPASGEVSAKTQYWLTASAYDPEEGDLPCSRLSWSASGSHTLNKSSNNRTCTAVVKFDDLGANTVTVSAVDSQGLAISKMVNVFVTPAPANLLPEIELDSFSISAVSTRFFSVSATQICLPGSICEVPEKGLLHNGQDGDFLSPLILRLNVSDPEGDPVAVEWHCQTGSQFAPITFNEDGSYSCTPIYSPTEPIKVYADVGERPPLGGDTNDIIGVRSAERTFYMLQRVN